MSDLTALTGEVRTLPVALERRRELEDAAALVALHRGAAAPLLVLLVFLRAAQPEDET